MKKRLWIRIVLCAVTVIFLIFAALVIYLSLTEYRPRDSQLPEQVQLVNGEDVPQGETITIYTWNIGYAGLDASADFFMDGGNDVNPKSEDVRRNLSAIKEFISSHSASAWLLQEVDVNSARTDHINELESISEVYSESFALAYNYKCEFVPIPLPPIGKVESGIATFTDRHVTTQPERISLPCPFSWPVSIANLKRCLLVTRLSVEESDKELVLVNLHLEAYDDGEGKIAQTKQLMSCLSAEYEKGNYVIAGGDFNQIFPESEEKYPISDGVWTPGVLSEDDLPEGFSYVFDSEVSSCRLLDDALNEDTQMYVIDGFIVSDNLKVELAKTVDLGFANADHNPVKLSFSLISD